MDEDLRYKHAEVVEVLDLLINAEDEAEEILVSYTDPMGNTFEAPVVIENFTDTLDMEIIEKFEEDADTVFMDNSLPAIDFHNAVTSDPGDDDDDDLDIWEGAPLKEEEPFEIDENQEWTGENSSYMSLEVAPEDRDVAEKELTIQEEKTKEDSNFNDLDFNISDNTEDEDLTSDFF